MASAADKPATADSRSLARAAGVIVISSAMFTFISYWRTAAVVLCDLAGSAFYVGGIAEQSIGKAAPWFILAVLLFSYAVRSVYIESSALFVRGGVYRVVKEAMGGFLAKLAVSALMFDYILTGPISGVSAGQYIVGLVIDTLSHCTSVQLGDALRDNIKAWGSVIIALLITLYFFRLNLIGIHESSGKALKIMVATTVMGMILLVWCVVTLAVNGPAVSADGTRNSIPPQPTFDSKPDPSDPTAHYDPLGFISNTTPGERLRELSSTSWSNWMNIVGLVGLALAFGHSILAMSGEETLAQVYREVESPKLPNFKKAAFIIFVYSLVLTGGVSFLAVLLIPDDVRMQGYSDNLIGGLSMYVLGPPLAKLLLHGFVVVVGFLILAGSVNTAIIGSNGVLNRVAEDGVLADWFLKPHPRYGTTYRLLYLITGLQLATILLSRGNVLALGEAYAFGVIWSFVFKALAMCVLRFTEPGPRPFKVPLNIRVGRYELPIGLSLIFLILLASALMNLLTKETATIWGLGFTAGFLTLFTVSERYNLRRRREVKHEHLEQFNERSESVISPETLGLTKPFLRVIAVWTPESLSTLDQTLAESDPCTTDVVVLVPKVGLPDEEGVVPVSLPESTSLPHHVQELLTAVVDRAERAGKEVHPLVVATNNPLHAIMSVARDLRARELILRTTKNLQVPAVMLGAPRRYSTAQQQQQIVALWDSLHQGKAAPMTVRLLSRNRDIRLELAGGARIPRGNGLAPHAAAELRTAGQGVHRALLACVSSSDDDFLLELAITAFNPGIELVMAYGSGTSTATDSGTPKLQERARQMGRALEVHRLEGEPGPALVKLARQAKCDLLVLPVTDGIASVTKEHDWRLHVVEHAPCPTFLAAPASTAPA